MKMQSQNFAGTRSLKDSNANALKRQLERDKLKNELIKFCILKKAQA